MDQQQQIIQQQMQRIQQLELITLLLLF